MPKPTAPRLHGLPAGLLILTCVSLIAGCTPEVSVSPPAGSEAQLRTYTVEKTALPSAQSPLENIQLWASTVRNHNRSLGDDSVALMLRLRAPTHQVPADHAMTLIIDGVPHRYDAPFYDGGMRYNDGVREMVGVDLPFALFQSLAYADSASLRLGDHPIPLPSRYRKGLRELTEQLQRPAP